MRNKYAEISKSVWDSALDYEGKPEPEAKPKHKYSDAEMDALVERANKRLQMKALGAKILAFENTPKEERKVIEERQADVATEMEQIVLEREQSGLTDEAMGRAIEDLARREKVTTDEVWRSANEFMTAEKYEGDKEEIKFYYPMTMEEAAEFLQTGKLVNKDESGNPLKSSLEFTADYRDDDGKWQSGFGLDGREVERKVTLVLDGKLLEANGFMALGTNPHAQEVDLRECCVGLVTERDMNDVSMLQLLTRQYKLPLPLYSRYDTASGADAWSMMAYSVEDLRERRDNWKEQLEREQEMYDQTYDNVSQEGIEEVTRISLERNRRANMDDLLQLKWELADNEERREAEQAILKYYCELLDIEEEPWVQHYQNEGDPAGAYYLHRWGSRAPIVRINEAKSNTMNLGNLMLIFAHELWHARQYQMRDRLNAGQLDGDAKRRAELYKYNYDNYTPITLDADTYMKQLVEVEARYFEAQSFKIFRQKYADAYRPLNRVKRRVQRVFGRA